MQLAIVVTGKQIRIADLVRPDVIAQPDRTAPDGGPEFVKATGRYKPEIRIGLFRTAVFRLEGTRVEEFRSGRVIATQNDAIVPTAKIANHLEVV